MVILGGGAPIVIDGNNHCTLTTIGRDRAGDVVGITGACGGPGATVTVAGTDRPVGTVVAANGELHYAVIKFDVPDLLPVSERGINRLKLELPVVDGGVGTAKQRETVPRFAAALRGCDETITACRS